MKRLVATVLLLSTIGVSSSVLGEEATVYVIKPGDTLWGLSERFIKDPQYWPNLWAKNPAITNPHFIYPGQKIKVYADHIEVVPAESPAPPQPVAQPAPQPEVAQESPQQPVQEEVKQPAKRQVLEEKPHDVTFTVSGGEGFIMEKKVKPYGFIVATSQNRQMVGEDDIVYTDIGRANGARVGNRFSIFKKKEAVSHPISNVILGYKVQPLGSLQLTQVEEKTSRAIIMKSYQEIGPGCYLMPYRDRKQEISLKAANRDLVGYIAATQTGNEGIGEGDIAYLDLGKEQGLEVGNFLYVVRDVKPDQKFLAFPVGDLPVEVLGALVVVATEDNTSTALIVKSIDTIYRGDRVELRKAR